MSKFWCKGLLFLAITVSGAASVTPANAQSAFEREVVRLTNQARVSGVTCGGKYRAPTHPLIWNSGLARAARAWSRRLSSTGKLTHAGMRQRINAVGLKACGKRLNWGENVAYNQSPQRVVARWLKSASHCKNIMNPQYRMIGVGMVQKGTRQYYTQLFHSSPGC